MKTLLPQAHPSIEPQHPMAPARAAAWGLALGLVLSLALGPLAHGLLSEARPLPSATPPRGALTPPPRSAPSATPSALPKPALSGLSSPEIAPTQSRSSREGPAGAEPRLAHQPESPLRERPRSKSEGGDLLEAEIPAAELAAGLNQAQANCLQAARLRDSRHSWTRFEVSAVRYLLQNPDLEAASYGELPAIQAELTWIAGLESREDLGRRSLEDLRFLLGAIHWYLEGVLAPPIGAEFHLGRAPSFDSERLREFAGLDFADLLAQWD